MTAIDDHVFTFALPDTERTTHEPGGPRDGRRVHVQPPPHALAWHERIIGCCARLRWRWSAGWRSTPTTPSTIQATRRPRCASDP